MKRFLLTSTFLCAFTAARANPQNNVATPGPTAASVNAVPVGGDVTANTLIATGAPSAETTAQFFRDISSLNTGPSFGFHMDGCVTSPKVPHDDAAAVQAIVAQAASDWTSLGQIDFIHIPAGCLYSSVGFVFPAGVPAHIQGAAWGASRFIWATAALTGTNFSGDTVSFDSVFGGNQIPTTGSTIGTPSVYSSAASVQWLTVIGNSTLTGNGIVYYGFDDHPLVEGNQLFYIPGCAICGGLIKSTTSGVLREGSIINNRIEVSGGGTNNYPEIGIYSNCSGTACASGTASNNLDIGNNRVYAYAVDGILFCDQNTNQGIHEITLEENSIEGGTGTNTGDGVHLGSSACTGQAPYSVHMFGGKDIVPAPGHAAFHIDGPSSYGTTQNAPYDITLHDVGITKGSTTGTTAVGMQVDYGGRGIVLDPAMAVTAGPQLVVGSGVTGTLTIGGGADSNTWTRTIGVPSTQVQNLARSIGSFTTGDAVVAADAYGTLKDGGAPTSAVSGTWSPTVTPTTLGDWAVTYTAQAGRYTQIAGLTCVDLSVTFTPTYTTASGTLQFSLPATLPAGETGTFGVSLLPAFTWPGPGTQVSFVPQSSRAYAFMAFAESTKAIPAAYASATTFATAGTYTVAGGGCFY